MALNSEFEPKIKSALVPVHFNSPVFLLLPSNTLSSSEVAPQVVPISNQFHEDLKLLYDLSLFMAAHKNDQMYSKSQAS